MRKHQPNQKSDIVIKRTQDETQTKNVTINEIHILEKSNSNQNVEMESVEDNIIEQQQLKQSRKAKQSYFKDSQEKEEIDRVIRLTDQIISEVDQISFNSTNKSPHAESTIKYKDMSKEQYIEKQKESQTKQDQHDKQPDIQYRTQQSIQYTRPNKIVQDISELIPDAKVDPVPQPVVKQPTVNTYIFSHLQKQVSELKIEQNNLLLRNQTLREPQKQYSRPRQNTTQIQPAKPKNISYHLKCAFINWQYLTNKKLVYNYKQKLSLNYRQNKLLSTAFSALANIYDEKQRYVNSINKARNTVTVHYKRLFFQDFVRNCFLQKLQRSKSRYVQILVQKSRKSLIFNAWRQKLTSLQKMSKLLPLQNSKLLKTAFHSLRFTTQKYARVPLQNIKNKHYYQFVAFTSWFDKTQHTKQCKQITNELISNSCLIVGQNSNELINQIINRRRIYQMGGWIDEQVKMYRYGFNKWRTFSQQRQNMKGFVQKVNKPVHALKMWRLALKMKQMKEYRQQNTKYNVFNVLKMKIKQKRQIIVNEQRLILKNENRLKKILVQFMLNKTRRNLHLQNRFEQITEIDNKRIVQKSFNILINKYVVRKRVNTFEQKIQHNFNRFLQFKALYCLTLKNKQNWYKNFTLNLKIQNQIQLLVQPQYQFDKIFKNQQLTFSVTDMIQIANQLIKYNSIQIEQIVQKQKLNNKFKADNEDLIVAQKLKEMRILLMSANDKIDLTLSANQVEEQHEEQNESEEPQIKQDEPKKYLSNRVTNYEESEDQLQTVQRIKNKLMAESLVSNSGEIAEIFKPTQNSKQIEDTVMLNSKLDELMK
ncbi:Hypothetical_protein [Hexamita inflata]|uniref:Hypothetical_protein n=1 Tax=Hexamita inflata TaxID=28002 RepID=A0AA86P402_9EUKA|nr:Hypothetical protein HINF_LOCUS17664 [Hexamita inflata]